MHRLFPISLLFLALILLRLGYVHGLFSPRSADVTQNPAPPTARDLAHPYPAPLTLAASRPAPSPAGSQARSDAAVVAEP